MEEIWKDIKGYEGIYQISSHGRLKSLSRPLIYKDGRKGTLKEIILIGAVASNGYRIVSLGKKEKKTMHRLVAETFMPNEYERTTINHKDGNKLNNRLDNLEWNSYKQNNDHARNKELNNQHGENTNFSKFGDQVVNALRKVHKETNFTYVKLAELFDMSPSTVKDIVSNKSRKKNSVY